MRFFCSLLIGCGLLVTAFVANASPTVIEQVTLIDGNGGKPLSGIYVMVEDGRVQKISNKMPDTFQESAVRINGNRSSDDSASATSRSETKPSRTNNVIRSPPF